MKRSKTMNAKIKPIVAACALALASGPAMALTDTYLIAKEFVKTLPDGSNVTMWGYAEDVGGACYNTTPISVRLTSPDCLNPVASAPGPELVIPVGEPDFRIFLTNLLPVPTSIFMTGQERPHSNNASNGPTWNDGSVGSRTNATQKVRSYGREAGANGGRRGYVWRTTRGTEIANPGGTFTYYSGTEPQKQVYMGLYGAVTKNAAAGEIYPGVPFVNEQVLFYSEIDPDHNAAVAALDPNYTPIHYHPSWFLINGEPYVAGTTADISLGSAGVPTLLRFLSTSSEKHVPVLQGMHGMIHAEDGVQYTWQDGVTGVETAAPREQYSVGLPPLQTKDVIVFPTQEGRYALYDGNGYMTNPSDPDVITSGDTVGGMLRFLSFGPSVANLAPTGLPDTLTIEFAEGVTTGVEGIVNVLENDTDPENLALSISAFDTTTVGLGGTVSCDQVTGDCTFTPELELGGFRYITGTGTFTYAVSDGVNDVPGVVVNVEVIENQAPSPVDDEVVTMPGVTLDFNVLANDLDNEDDTLQIITLDATGVVEGTLTCDNATGDCSYVPPAVPSTLPLIEIFTYTVDDGINPESAPPTSVTINLNASVPMAPEGVADNYPMDEDAILDVAAPGVLENDTDANGDPLTAVLVTGPSNARPDAPNGGFTFNADGSFHYEPAADFNGDDSFTYVANDGTADSLPVTVTISVAPQNDAPVANNDTFLLQDALLTTLDGDGQPLETIFNIAPPGVLENDVDLEDDPLTVVEVNDPDAETPELTGNDGSATFVADNTAAGLLGSLSYEATDTSGAVSGVAQADFVRLVSLSRSEYNQREDANPANDDWRIRGSVDASIAPGTQVHVFLVRGGVDVQEILPTVTGNNNGQVRNNLNWGINANNSGPQPQPGDTLRVEVEGNPDAVYLNYPVFIMP